MPSAPISVLIVCYANLARSPMAEAVLRHLAAEHGYASQLVIDSAGTNCLYPGEPACEGTLKVLEQHGITAPSRSRQLEYADLNQFDHVLAVDRRVLNFVQRHRRGTRAAVDLFLAAAVQQGVLTVTEIADPFPDGDFDTTYRLIRAGSLAFLRQLHLLPTK